MICTVSTVLDTPENVDRFVRRNLAAGVDHMFVFLDEHQPRVRALLDPLPQVTAIGTGDGYWDGRRPPNLNNRQTANANLARVLLSCLDWPRWLFHIDADECLDIDRTKLLALDETVPAVVLTTLEAVSTPGGDPQERFKRQLGEEDLALLHLLGIIGRPSNTSLFNSHAHGKVGIRPTLDFNLHIHRARYPDRDFVESYEAEWLRLLHYDSTSVEEFIRKWSTHAASVSDSAFGRERTAILASVRSVQRNQSLSDERRQHYFAEIYRRTRSRTTSTPWRTWASSRPRRRTGTATCRSRCPRTGRPPCCGCWPSSGPRTRATSVRDAPASSRSTCSVA